MNGIDMLSTETTYILNFKTPMKIGMSLYRNDCGNINMNTNIAKVLNFKTKEPLGKTTS
jgi:hypothetical protein